MTPPAIIILNEMDNVAVARQQLAANEWVGLDRVVCREAIPAGHKIALESIAPQCPIIKYGHPIGMATRDPAECSRSHP